MSRSRRWIFLCRRRLLNLLADLQEEFNLAYVFICQPRPVGGAIADDVLVMHKGEAVEQGTREAVFADPKHPLYA